MKKQTPNPRVPMLLLEVMELFAEAMAKVDGFLAGPDSICAETLHQSGNGHIRLKTANDTSHVAFFSLGSLNQKQIKK